MPARTVHLRKRCPVCAGPGRADAKLAGFPGTRPPEFDLDDLDGLAAKHSLGILLALVELLPYKQFTCAGCGYRFRLANRDAKTLVLDMLSAMQPVPDDGTNGLTAAHTARAPHRARAARSAAARVEPSRPGQPAPGASVADQAPAALSPSIPDWEPEGLD